MFPSATVQLEAFRDGVVTSASLMVNGCTAASMAERAARAGLGLGLHLNLTEGVPVASPDRVPTLWITDDGGRPAMRGKMGFRQAWEERLVDPADVAREVEAQLDRFVELAGGRSPTHVDGHQHVHVLPGIDELLAAAMQRRGLCWTRIPERCEALDPWTEADSGPERRRFLQSVSDDARRARAVFAAHGVRAPECFAGFGYMGSAMSVGKLRDLLRRLEAPEVTPPSSLELMTHPGHVTTPETCTGTERSSIARAGDEDGVGGEEREEREEPRGARGAPRAWWAAVAGCGTPPDDFAADPARAHELRSLVQAADAWRASPAIVLRSFGGLDVGE